MIVGAAAILGLWLQQQATPPSKAPPPGTTISGVVVNADTRGPLSGARVVVVEAGKAVITGGDGRFTVAGLAPGRYTLTVSIIGYAFVERSVDVTAGAAIDLTVPITEGTGAYREQVTVQGDDRTPPEVGVASQSQIGAAELLSLRGAAAEDPIRAIQALPGVATGDDFNAEISMRGFAFNQMSLVMDGTATPLLLHALRGQGDSGSIAMINSDVLAGASLVAGPQPQRDGDWLGSTLGFPVREGSRDRAGFHLSVSGTSASGVGEGPIGAHHRGSWLVSVRKSYIDWVVRKVDPGIESTLGFADTQGKLTFDLTSRQQVQFMFVGGLAALDSPQDTSANGLNHATSNGGVLAATWRHTADAAIYTMRVGVTDNHFTNRGSNGQVLGNGNIGERIWRADAVWILSPRWTAEAGLKAQSSREGVVLQDFVLSRGLPVVRQAENRASVSTVADGWGQLTWRGDTGGIVFGARTAHESLTGATVASPWLLAERRVGTFNLRAGVGESHQFPDLDSQIGAVQTLTPARALSFDAGFDQAIGHGWHWQITGFTRKDDDVIRQVGEDQLLSSGERIVASAFPEFRSTLSGPTHGADFVVSRRAPTGVNGWVAYTYSHTRYRDSVSGESFDGDFDQRHTLNVFLEQRLSYRLSVNGKLRIGSNFPLTGFFSGSADALRLGTTYNAVRLPVYARLDLRANRTFAFSRRRLTLFVEVLNVLNRRNLGQLEGVINSTTLAAIGYTTGLIPRLPSAGLLFEF